MMNHKPAPIFGSHGNVREPTRSRLGAGDANENVLPWSNGGLHPILADSRLDVAACSQKAHTSRGLHRAEQVSSSKRYSESIHLALAIATLLGAVMLHVAASSPASCGFLR